VYRRAEELSMSEEHKQGKQFDPMEPWRGVRDAYLDTWAKSMVEMVNTDAYAQATGAMLDTYLTVSTPFREAVEKAMLKTLEQLAMPSRADVVSIAERMTNIEMRLDDLDAKLDEIQKLVTPSRASSHPAVKPATKSKVKTAQKQAKRSKK
jgi:polyhydroxyalkanoic acid synthase PhaR subunit